MAEQQGAWGTKNDPLYDDAVALVRKHKRVSISLVQRHLAIGWNRAHGLIDAMVGTVLTDMPPIGKVIPAGVPVAPAPEPSWWAASLNRRATVEQWMFDAARGKRPMPTPDELRAWAIKLGTPEAGEPSNGVTVVRPMHDAKAERERFEAAYAAIPPITPTKETAWRVWNMARAYGLIAASGVKEVPRG